MHRLIWTVIAAFVMALVFGPILIPWLKKIKFGQTIYDLGPESHKKKQGTPNMGGILIGGFTVISAVAVTPLTVPKTLSSSGVSVPAMYQPMNLLPSFTGEAGRWSVSPSVTICCDTTAPSTLKV